MRSVNAEKAVRLMQIYIGSVDRVSVPTAQKMYRKIRKEIDRIEEKTGVTDAWEQVEREARKRGGILATPGKDY